MDDNDDEDAPHTSLRRSSNLHPFHNGASDIRKWGEDEIVLYGLTCSKNEMPMRK